MVLTAADTVGGQPAESTLESQIKPGGDSGRPPRSPHEGAATGFIGVRSKNYKDKYIFPSRSSGVTGRYDPRSAATPPVRPLARVAIRRSPARPDGGHGNVGEGRASATEFPAVRRRTASVPVGVCRGGGAHACGPPDGSSGTGTETIRGTTDALRPRRQGLLGPPERSPLLSPARVS